MPATVPPPEPPAIVDRADGGFAGNWQTGHNTLGSVRYHPKTNSLTLGSGYNDPETRANSHWAMVFNTASKDEARAAAEIYKKTGLGPKTGANNFYCSATFNGTTRTEQVTHVPQLENSLPGTGNAYSHKSADQITYARGQAAVDSMMKQAKTVCGLAGNVPEFKP